MSLAINSKHHNSYYTLLRKLRQRDATKFHIQLCIALSCMFIVFVVGIDRVEHREGCITVGVLIHYFALAAWMWMGAEALLMFQKLVIVFSNITLRHLLIISVICWSKSILLIRNTCSLFHSCSTCACYSNSSN